MTARKRANQWDTPGADARLNPLGQRLLQAMRLAGATPSDFGPSAESRNAAATHFARLTAGSRENLELETLVGYARRAGVSFQWLAIGEGQPFDEVPFARLGDAVELRGFPEPLQRAVQAYLLLSGRERERVFEAARAAYLGHSGKRLSARSWYNALLGQMAGDDEESGVREKT